MRPEGGGDQRTGSFPFDKLGTILSLIAGGISHAGRHVHENDGTSVGRMRLDAGGRRGARATLGKPAQGRESEDTAGGTPTCRGGARKIIRWLGRPWGAAVVPSAG